MFEQLIPDLIISHHKDSPNGTGDYLIAYHPVGPLALMSELNEWLKDHKEYGLYEVLYLGYGQIGITFQDTECLLAFYLKFI